MAKQKVERSYLPFIPAFLLKNPHAQTLAGHFSGKLPWLAPHLPGLRSEKFIIPCDDNTGDRLLFYVHRYWKKSIPDLPAVVLVHGLEGDAKSPYILILTRKLLQAGFHVIRFNMRTCGDGIHIARNAYNAGLTIDVETILKFARRNLSRRLALVGFSLGANVVLKYMGEDRTERNRQLDNFKTPGKKGPIEDRFAQVFVAVSPPLDLKASCQKIDSGEMKIYRLNFLREMKRSILEKNYRLPFDPAAALPEIRTIFDLDNAFTAPLGGFATALDYYRACSSLNFIRSIQTPGMVLHAQDDPMIALDGWLRASWSELPRIDAILTDQGGHLGWICNWHPRITDRRWMDHMVVDYLLEWRDSGGQ